MTKGTTSTGFAFEYDETRLDDMRFVDVLAKVVDPEATLLEKVSGTSRLVSMLLGEDIKAALYAHIGAAHEGRVPRAELETALGEIMAAAGKDAEKNF